jgi:hypothetical protein
MHETMAAFGCKKLALRTTSQRSSPAIWRETINQQKMFLPLQTQPFNSLTAIGPYMAHRLSWALFKVNNFLNLCPLTVFDS